MAFLGLLRFNMAASIIRTTSLLLTCLALLSLLATATQARPLQTENPPNKLAMIVTVTETREMTESLIKGKAAPSPPSPKSSPPTKQVTTNYPAPEPDTPISQLQLLVSSCAKRSPCDSLISMYTKFGKTTKSPPSPKPAPSKHQGTIKQPRQRRSSLDFQFKSMSADLGKTPKSPPSPKPAPSEHQGMVEQIMQNSTTDFQIASF